MKKILLLITILFTAILQAHTYPSGINLDLLDCKVDIELDRFRESETNKDHKYYVSVSNVKYNEKAGALQMVSRFFIDDMQQVLNARNPTAVELGKPEEIEDHYKSIQLYLSSKIFVRINGSNIRPTLIGAEYDNDQIILYIEFKTESSPDEIEMTFSAFCEFFEEQQNLVHFKINDERKTLVLDRSVPKDVVKF